MNNPLILAKSDNKLPYQKLRQFPAIHYLCGLLTDSHTYTTVKELFEAFNQLKVMVIGDVMVDAYLWGKVDRISPEAPVPIVAISKRESRLGGAANVAINIQTMGATPILCSVIGADRSGEELLSLMKELGMNVDGMVTSTERVTTVKTRVIGNNHQLLRVDDEEISEMMDLIIERGGKVKNLYGAEGKKISYYQVKATYFSALGENEQKLLLARAIQMFMPGIPQIWYLDIFAGANDYEAVEKAGKDGHKEINRTTLSLKDIEDGLKKEVVTKQLEIIRLRNTSKAFSGTVAFKETTDEEINIIWTNDGEFAQLQANLKTHDFSIRYSELGHEKSIKL